MGRKHTERVVKLCKRFSEELLLSDHEKTLLLQSAELHDEFKGKVDDSQHAMSAADDIIKNRKTNNPESAAAIVLAHCGKFDPPMNAWYLAAILRMSDKLDKFNKRKTSAKEAFKSCRKNWDEIECWYCGHSMKEDTQFMSLMRTYRGILKEY